MDLALVDDEHEVLLMASKCFIIRDERQRLWKGVPFAGRLGKNDSEK